MLVPEIALTPAVAGQFHARFGERVAILHSAFSGSERAGQWRRIREGTASVVVATRSGVFAPVRNVGLIVVNEEHDSSYKQEENAALSTAAMSPLCGPRPRALASCSARPRPASRAATTPPPASTLCSNCPTASRTGPCLPCASSICGRSSSKPASTRSFPALSSRPSANGSPTTNRPWCCSIAGASPPSSPAVRAARASSASTVPSR